MASLPAAPLALVVDDDPVTRQLVRLALEGLGCRSVLQAQDGLEAQALLLERSDIDLVLTDILMPGLDGLDLLRWGREHAPGTIWIILSGMDTFDSAVEAIRLGAFDFLAKPPRVAELEVAVRNALERRSLLVEQERLHEQLQLTNQQLVEKLREVEEKSELLQRDLERAEVIQRALLPSAPPLIERFCVHALYRPGQHVGGDLYDVLRIGERHVALYVADATGHGVTAAMLSVLFKHHLVLRDGQTGQPLGPATVLAAVNRALEKAVAAPGLFLTAVYGLLDTHIGELTLASAGHPPVLHVRASGEIRMIQRTGPALGLTVGAHFGEESFRLEPGDRLFLYTDGLADAGATERLHELLRLPADRGEEVLARLLMEANADVPAEERDDVTLVLLEVGSGTSGFDNGDASAVAIGSAAAPGRAGVVHYGEAEHASYLALQGRATWVHSAAFYQTARAIRAAGRALVLDLSRCDYLDSTFLGTIHELTERGGVHLQNVRPEVRALFEELGMDRVLECIRAGGVPVPELYPLAAPRVDTDTGRRRILEAHEALSVLSDRNRVSFAGVIEGLRGSSETG